jgi:hypothetical protein
MVELTIVQAEEVLDKERSYMIAHGGEYQVEAYNMAIRALNNYKKFENIKQIVSEWNNDASHSFEDMCKINGILKEYKGEMKNEKL